MIEDARARQRHRRITTTLLLLAVGVAAAVSYGAPGGALLAQRHVLAPRAAPPSTRAVLVDCNGQPGDLTGRPDRALLSILAALRRPATPTDTLPANLQQSINMYQYLPPGVAIFTRYIRRTAVIAGSPYYLVPVRFSTCPGEAYTASYDGVLVRGDDAGAAGIPADIEQGLVYSAIGWFTHTTVTMLVPDSVATVTLHYPAGRVGGSNRHHAPAVTIATKPVGNLIVVAIPRGGNRLTATTTMTWRNTVGHVIATFNRL